MTTFDPFENFNPFSLEELESTDLGRRAILEQARPEIPGFGGSSGSDIFRSLFDNIIGDFLQEIGTSFRSGEMPERSFTDFVNAQDFARQIRREGANRRRTSGLTSAARFLFDR